MLTSYYTLGEAFHDNGYATGHFGKGILVLSRTARWSMDLATDQLNRVKRRVVHLDEYLADTEAVIPVLNPGYMWTVVLMP